MKYRKFGNTGIEVSEIGFGGWQISGDWGDIDDRPNEVLAKAVDRGINLFDSAYVYGDGASERALGQGLKPYRDKIYLTSKIPPKNFKWDIKAHHKVSDFYDKKWIVEATERSLKNFDVECIDMMMLHTWNDVMVEQTEWYEAMLQLKKAGKIRFIGASIKSWDFDQGIPGMENGMLEMVQLLYNIFEQRPQDLFLPAAQKYGVGVIARVPFDEGLLTGKFKPGHQFAPKDWRGSWMTEERLKEAFPRVQALEKFLNDDIPTLADLAIKFCLGHPAVGSVIAGMRKLSHVDMNSQTAERPDLPAEILEELKKHAWPHNWHYDGDED